jgi:sulfur carrier protein ThiS
MKIKIILHNSFKNKNEKPEDMEFEIEEDKTIEELLMKIGIRDIDSVMVFGNDNILRKKEVIKDIDVLKVYPVVQGG